MKLVKSILEKNPCYKAGKKITVKGLMLHSVGCSQPKASAVISNWNREDFNSACVHAFIDGNDGTVYQTLPWDHRGWHAGGGANNTHIGVEMCEPACITYMPNSSKFTCSDMDQARTVAVRTYQAAVELFSFLCKEYGLDPLKDIISHSEGHKLGVASNHGDPEHLWTQLGLGYTMDTFRQDVKAAMLPEAGTQASVFAGISEAQAVAKIGPLCSEEQKRSGILASIIAAQFILESGYGKSELAQNANNCFGMKTCLSGNSWSGSTWDGTSKYAKRTSEEYVKGEYTEITADFRKYSCIEDSLADHSAYLLGAKKGNDLRYAGIQGNTDYKKVAQLIKDGGYATSSTYVEKLCNIIEKWHLTQYDVPTLNAITEAKPENEIPAVPFSVKVIIPDLNYRAEPSMKGAIRGVTGIGTFTIVEVKDGWGHLKSDAGWIWLKNPDYCTIGKTVSVPPKAVKSVDELAKEVIRGAWGNGTERKQRLEAAGYNYAAIQKRVNELLK